MAETQEAITPIEEALNSWQDETFERPAAVEADAGEIPIYSDAEIEEARSQAEEEGGAEESEEAEGKEASSQQPEVPATLRIGETEVATDTVVATYSELLGLQEQLKSDGIMEPLPEVIGAGVTHLTLMAEFDKGPAQAEEVINSVVQAFVSSHGGDLTAAEIKGVLDVVVNPAEMTPVEKRLYALNQGLQARIAELGSTMEKLVNEGKKAVQEKGQMETAEQEINLIKAAHPDAKLSAKDVIALKEKHGVKDALAAYRLENFDNLTTKAKDKGLEEGAKTKPGIPKGGDAVKIDAENMTVSQIERALQRQATAGLAAGAK